MKASKVLAMSTKDRQRLAQMLRRLRDAMDLEELDGFLAAVICSPRTVSPTEYLPPIWGGESLAEPVFADQGDKDELLRLAVLHWSDVVGRLVTDEPFEPLLLEDEDAGVVANAWARGFVRGVGLSPADWEDVNEDGELSGALMAIAALAYEHDPQTPLFAEPLEPERRRRLIAAVAEVVPLLYDYFMPRRERTAPLAGGETEPWYDEPITYRREGPKVGRNGPCPCGSGKKYKRCCGARQG